MITHNDLEVGDLIEIENCDGNFTVTEIHDGYRGIRVNPPHPTHGDFIDVSMIVLIEGRD